MFSLQILLGRVCTIAELHKKELPVVTRASDKAQFDCPSSSSKSVDYEAKRYLEDLLLEISKAGGGELIPVTVEIHLELKENADWYMGKMSLYHNVSNDSSCADFPDVIGTAAANDCPLSEIPGSSAKIKTIKAEVHLVPAFTEEEYDELLRAAVPDYADYAEWSPFEHCQVMSNILKRPVCLFTSLEDLDRQESFIFLPLRHPADECYKHPMSIAWQKRGENNELSHFVPLCRTMDSTAPLIPSHCQPAIYRCTKEIARQYIDYCEDNSFRIGVPVQYSEIEPTHLFNTMGCRFKPHKPKQPGFFHGLIDKLISASYQELSKETALENLFSLCLSLDNGDVQGGLESSKRMIATDLLIKLYISRIGFDSVLHCATSTVAMSLSDSLLQMSSNILQMYSTECDRQSINSERLNSFKLEIDEHVVTAMIKIETLNIVTDSALKGYMKYVQAVHIDSLIQGEYRRFIGSKSRAIVASSNLTPYSAGAVSSASLSDTTGAVSETPVPVSVPTLLSSTTPPVAGTGDCTSVPSDVSYEGGMSAKEQETLLYLSRCKAVASQHLKNMRSNLLSTFSGQEAVKWTQRRSRNRAEHSRAEHTQSSLHYTVRPDSGSGPGSGSGSEGMRVQENSGESTTLQPVTAPIEGTSDGSVQSRELSKCQKKRSIGDI